MIMPSVVLIIQTKRSMRWSDIKTTFSSCIVDGLRHKLQSQKWDELSSKRLRGVFSLGTTANKSFRSVTYCVSSF